MKICGVLLLLLFLASCSLSAEDLPKDDVSTEVQNSNDTESK